MQLGRVSLDWNGCFDELDKLQEFGGAVECRRGGKGCSGHVVELSRILGEAANELREAGGVVGIGGDGKTC